MSARSPGLIRTFLQVVAFLLWPIWASLPTQQEINDIASCRKDGYYVDLTSASYNMASVSAPIPGCVATCPAGSISFPGSCVAQEQPVAIGIRLGLTFLLQCDTSLDNCTWISDDSLISESMTLRVSQLLGGLPQQELRGSHITLPSSNVELQGIYITRRGEPGFSSRRLNEVDPSVENSKRSLSGNGVRVYVVARADTRRLAPDSPVVQQLLNGNTTLASWFLGLPVSIFNATLSVGLPVDGVGSDEDFQLAIGFKGLPWTIVRFVVPSTWIATTRVTTTSFAGFLSQGTAEDESDNWFIWAIVLIVTVLACILNYGIFLVLRRRRRSRDLLAFETDEARMLQIVDKEVDDEDFLNTDEYPEALKAPSEASEIWRPAASPTVANPLTPSGHFQRDREISSRCSTPTTRLASSPTVSSSFTPSGHFNEGHIQHDTEFSRPFSEAKKPFTPPGTSALAKASTPMSLDREVAPSTNPATWDQQVSTPKSLNIGTPGSAAWYNQVLTPIAGCSIPSTPKRDTQIPSTPSAGWSRSARTPMRGPTNARVPKTPKRRKGVPITPRQTEPTILEHPELEEADEHDRGAGLSGLMSPRDDSIPSDTARVNSVNTRAPKDNQPPPHILGAIPTPAEMASRTYENGTSQEEPPEHDGLTSDGVVSGLMSPRDDSIPSDSARVNGVHTRFPKSNQPPPYIMGSTPTPADIASHTNESGSSQKEPPDHEDATSDGVVLDSMSPRDDMIPADTAVVNSVNTRRPKDNQIPPRISVTTPTAAKMVSRADENETSQLQPPEHESFTGDGDGDVSFAPNASDRSQSLEILDVNALEAELQAMCAKPLEERKYFFRQQCLRCHPDKNLQDKEMAGQAFQFLQSKKDWFLS